MKKIFLALFIAFYSLLSTQVSAHMIGQPPYFKVNGVFTDFYPVPSTSLIDFRLPNDITKENFLVNQPIQFEIDKTQIPVPAEIVDKTKFIWDFGDGSTASGLNNTHIYSKPGTYFLDIKADSRDGFEAQLMQSTAINILPDKNYQLPKAVIEINGQQSNDPLLDIKDVNFSKDIKFDASKSTGGSSEITEYTWDLGDQNTESRASFVYKYKDNPYTVFPLLRIKTKDGFITDSFIQIKDEKAFSDSKQESPSSLGNLDWKIIILAVLASLVLACVITFIVSRILNKHS